MSTLKDVLNGNVPEESMHRSTTKERPSEEVKLNSVSKESVQHTKTQKDPTDDLVALTTRMGQDFDVVKAEGFLVYCKDTTDIWYAPDKLCLDKNFIYREDLEIYAITNLEEAEAWFMDRYRRHERGTHPSTKCYILDNPCNETYEVYYDSNYPTLKYGKATPRGCFIHQFPNRFHRDMAILELDDLYSNSSLKQAVQLTKREFKDNEAIIVSDGAWMKETCSAACFYLDNKQGVKLTNGFCPTEPDQAVLIAEITAATLALGVCKVFSKKKIKYYYDNTSILNVFRNRKTEYIEEIKKYKDLLIEMDKQGYQVEFIELHPKTGENRDTDNHALQFFHNRCDSECREMADVFAKDYRQFAVQADKKGTTYRQFKSDNDAKKGNKQKQNYKKPNGNRY